MKVAEVGLEHSQRVQDRLLQRMDDLEYGTKARVERELGLYSGFFNNRRGRGDLGLGVVIAALIYLEEDVGRFINDALGESGVPVRAVPKVSSEIAKVIAGEWGLAPTKEGQ